MDKVVRQALIFAGGHGTRMSSRYNVKGCKSLIEYAKQSMLGHLIDALIGGGIEEFIFVVDTHCEKDVRNIVINKRIKNSIISDGTGFNKIPYNLRSVLDDRYFMVCGHHPLTTTHVISMLDSSKQNRHVMSAYNNKLYTMDKVERIVMNGDKLEFTDLSKANLPVDHWYARNPYIIGKEVAVSAHNDQYLQSFSYYVFNRLTFGEKIGIVKANMPPEFDYDSEFERTKLFLEQK